jgi:hypothetical protein
MNMNKVIFIAIGVVVVVALAWWGLSRKTAEPETNNTTNNTTEALVQVTSPTPNQTITSPLVVTGQAVGNWYFEASFPIELRDANQTVIATGLAEAQSDWMVTTLVPFISTITFVPPTTPTGFLVMIKDNPSGEPQFDDSLSIPVVF